MVLIVSGCTVAPGLKSPESVAVKKVLVDSTGQKQISVSPLKDAIRLNGSAEASDLPELLTSTQAITQYKIDSRDVLSILVWNHPQLMKGLASVSESGISTGITVQEDGYIYFPYAGRVYVAGKTIEQVRKIITAKLSKFIKTPQVSVAVARYASKRVYVLGEVENPKMIALSAYPLTMLEAIALAGGLKETASTQTAYLLRQGKRHSLPLNALLNSGRVEFNINLQEGDVLHIPDNVNEKVFVLGSVQKPMAYRLAGGRVSLSEVLAESGGLDPLRSDASKVYVIRGNINKPEIYHLDLESADALLLGEQFLLQSRDVIYVASSGISDWSRVLNLILPNIQTLFYLDSLNRR
ncbi:MAG: polysaccharide biosynthesis/export family protein [Gammaproteobacteria bacterium]|nr:polysaccharide biosynthesis/export family protein [Gammaproteobacteria bacterium]